MKTTRVARPWLWAAAGSALVILALGFILRGGLLLTVTPVKRGEECGPPLWEAVLMPGERFTINYYHSVENAPIWETHSLDAQGRIYIEEERYLKFGAGMGKMPGVGHMVRKGRYEAIVDMHMPTGDFILRIGSPGVDHTIIWRGSRVNLSAIAPHQAVRFKARPICLWRRLWLALFPPTAMPQPDRAGTQPAGPDNPRSRREG